MARTTTGSSEASLTAALQPVVRSLVADMRARLEADAPRLQSWKTEHAEAQKADRVASSFAEWSEEQLQQAAAGWVLTTVFLRFIEDNDLFGPRQVFLTGFDAERRALGRDFQDALYQRHPEYSYRDYLRHCFDQLKDVPATAGLVGPHSSIHVMEPSDDGARELIEFWRAVDGDGNTLRTFNDEKLDTRFLGDMYQDLSEFARKKYALLQTPEFVEEFILDRTMDPALDERPLEGFKVIDPTCGSGHFLLGAFHRLMDRWEHHSPAMPAPERAEKAMLAIHGVDINPFAVAISQFRLTVAFIQAAGDTRLTERSAAPGFTVLAGDSLLFGPDSVGQSAMVLGTRYSAATEDPETLEDVLEPQSYDVVVGNPPYITVKDKALNKLYRSKYGDYLSGKYALTSPFMVKFFRLAKGPNVTGPAGWVGQITSNSFMQRQFGKPLIEQFFGEVDLREVIDTSGAYVPGHGTPTAILVGRHSHPSRRKVVGVLGIQGEPGVPADPAHGVVWSSIVDNIDHIDYEDSHISVTELDRDFIRTHPWSLQGGSTPQTLASIKYACTLDEKVESVGFAAITGEDDAFVRPYDRIRNRNNHIPVRPFIEGKNARDFRINIHSESIFLQGIDEIGPTVERFIWPNKKRLNEGLVFGESKANRRIPYYHYTLPNNKRLDAERLICFPFVATHNHFILDRGGKVFNRTAPVIKLPDDATEDDHLALIGVLNSSTACFWLKQNSYPKSGGAQPWADRYEFTGTTLQKFPLPDGDVTERGRRLDDLAQQLATFEPSAVFERTTPTGEAIDDAYDNYMRIRRLMIAEQEELDWAVYHLYGLTDTDLSLPVGDVDGIDLGTRPFEIALARRVAAGETTTAWFERHHSTPVTEVPDSWPDAQRTAAQQRLDLMASDKSIKLLEAPEYKRRWSDDPWEDKVHEALADWLLTRLETPELWRRTDGMAQTRTIRELAGQVETDPELADVLSVLPLWSTKRGATTEKMLEDLLKNEAVPYAASLRYKGRGVAKRVEWEATWEAQRREDAGEIKADDVPVPPNYTSTDMYPTTWKHRGKLDVPKERFISYPGASPEGDTTMLLGWAGWNDLDKALALMSLFSDRADQDADTETLAAILYGLAEVLPWVRQWHNEIDPQLNLRFGDYLTSQLEEAVRGLGILIDDLDKYAPTPAKRGRAKTKK
ncbi:MAG: BREX-2 system adenine-specific DNA-methyltransferase PglX [Corynebacterium sp.]|uniref:BREX-2 system adenine-specific DNA-methyltransferase PglX n=1 Tax=Corynebacterium sp. TaxID=1720 RepID=UPI002649C4B4|nr:BREX-2 system adenine-specific DNA-methyltransferase PglX [Corynebacterium sp.]MDN6281832.1 BREX-2 system adenine-specific DNA-methyltransferase PglX [Corynebacterium sp.]MDN6305536.1 BREX-2 system adenine-specific DNA-methyltransferase PglX [Corynebacterium sp.]MDN6367702.1 BREX-2 system adenine-specific DNA-methyltransferase PglX [Corynebacterium sp.]MDN6375104.1 BREX-2 system adenine-specific DNA-methyltransferase PglX [Corynebacterium sp.]MDN6396261.1 BREX-2 system adenine-specific DNA-